MQSNTYISFRLDDHITAGLNRISETFRNLDRQMGQVDRTTARLNTNAGNRFQQMAASAQRSFSNIPNQLRAFHAQHAEGIRSAMAEIPGASGALALASNPYAIAAAGAVAFTAVSAKAYKANEQFDKMMAKANVTAQMGAGELRNYKNELVKIASNSYVDDLTKIPQAFERIISAGISAPEALKTMEPTLKAAKGGFTDLEETAAAAVGVMNASGIHDATRIYDILFATVNKGNVQFKDLSEYLPKIIPGARAAGFSLEQTAAAYAQLTANGQSAMGAANNLENAFKALADVDVIYGGAKREGLERLGIPVYEANGQKREMIKIIQDIGDKTKNLTDRQKDLFMDNIGFDMEAKRAILGLSINMKGYGDTLNFVTNSQGQLNKAFENSMTAGDRWTVASNKWGAAMIKFGDAISPVINKLADLIATISTDIDNAFTAGNSSKDFDYVSKFKQKVNFEAFGKYPLAQKVAKLTQQGNFDEARSLIEKSEIFGEKLGKNGVEKYNKMLEVGFGKSKEIKLSEPKLPAPTSKLPTAGAASDLLPNLPKGKKEKEKEAAARTEKGNNVRNVTVTIQKQVGIETAIFTQGTDDPALERTIRQTLSNMMTGAVHDAEIGLD